MLKKYLNIVPFSMSTIEQCFADNKFHIWLTVCEIHGPAEIPDDFAKQLWVEPLAWGICPWALFWRDSKHFSCHGALVCRISGFCCGDVFQKQRFCLDSRGYFVGTSIFIGTSVASHNTSSSEDISRARTNQGQWWIWNRTSGKKWQQFLPTCCNDWCRTSTNACGNVLTTSDATSQTLYSGSECCN